MCLLLSGQELYRGKLKENWKYYIFEVRHCTLPGGIWSGYEYKINMRKLSKYSRKKSMAVRSSLSQQVVIIIVYDCQTTAFHQMQVYMVHISIFF